LVGEKNPKFLERIFLGVQMDVFQESISEVIWDVKYRYRYKNKIKDQTIEQTWQRVAKAVAKTEIPTQRSHWQQKFFEILENFDFLPGGRILAGAGTKHQVTLFNCFVMPVYDSLHSIFTALKEGAITLQEGGGIGYDFSMLRPAGFPVEDIGGIASGPVSFMRIWNAMCATMLSTGVRRGAMMGLLRCDHPDIESFIAAKSDAHELRHFNVSVLVTDEFIQAVKKNLDWELVFPVTDKNNQNVILRRWSGQENPIACQVVKRVKARDLWQNIIKSAYDYAEPGVIFEDTINRQNNLKYCEWINATNPCGEIPLPAYGACNLGAINLVNCVINPYTPQASINWQKLENMTQVATRFLDNVINVTRYPLRAQKRESFSKRRIGLGVTGLADAFVMLCMRYGDEASLQLAQQLMKRISEVTWQTSVDLAQERCPFPLFDKENYLRSEFVMNLPQELRNDIAKKGIRNSHHNTIAPAGTISLLANNISNGIEPIFSSRYDRTVRLLNGIEKFSVTDYALRVWHSHQNLPTLPPAWVDSQSLLPEDHLQIQGAMQPYIDNAISKTINLPENFPFAKLNEIYMQAYDLHLKGCTIFRPNAVTGSVLTVAQQENEKGGCDWCKED
jgi:ribonucleoside-diphosphate reductase alpha chain